MAYKIFTPLSASSDIITIIGGTEVTTGLWSGDTGSLAAIYTSSVQVGVSGEFYYDLYDGSSPTDSDIQFSVAYGHISGGASPSVISLNTSTVPTQVTYAQYRNILLDKGIQKFSFGGVESDDIYVINIQRSRLKQAIDPGNWQLSLSGSRGIISLVDDSGLGTAVAGNLVADNVHNIRSGSLTLSGTVNQADTTVYGLVFPDYGVIVLRPAAISSSVGFQPNNSSNIARTNSSAPFAPYTGSGVTSYQYAHEGLVRAISGSMAANYPFIARSAEKITSTNYFIRLRNNEYNYSNNTTYYTGSLPQQVLEPFRFKPITYVTTIGLYNDQNELLAIAKLSKPVQKSIDKEALIRVRLDY